MRVALAIIILCQSILATAAIIGLLHTQRDPLVVLNSRMITPEVKFGDFIVVAHTYVRNAYCKVDIDRFILTDPGGALVRRERLPAGTTLIGTETRTVNIPTKFPSQLVIPFGIADAGVQDLFPGQSYTLREFLHSDCGDRLHTALVPDLHFRIVE